MPSKKRLGDVSKNLILLFGSLCLTLFLIEIGLTIFSWSVYPRLTISDESLGWKYKPDSQATRTFSADITYSIKINRDGFRDNEFSKGNDHLKIMVLGDSMTFGLETDQASIFTNLLEIELNSKLKPVPIDVMNFGITGFSTAQELLTLRKYGPEYKPGLVLLMLFEDNDFTDNITSFQGGRFAPHFRLKDDKLIFYGCPSRSERILTWLRDHSTLFFVLTQKTGWGPKLLRRRYDVDEQGQITLVIKLLEEIFLYVGRQKINFHLFYITDTVIGNTRLADIQTFSEQKGIPITTIPLREEERVNGNGHWNEKGHRAVTEIIANQIFNDIEKLSTFYRIESNE